MNVKEKMLKARAMLILDAPFFASIILRLPYIENNTIPTMATDGTMIIYNSDFVKSLTLDEVKGVLCHEAMHIINLHHTRRQSRSPELWNIATDYSINQIIEDAGLKLPKLRLRDAKYDEKTAEEIYNLLPDDISSLLNGNIGAVLDYSGQERNSRPSQSEIKQHEQEVKIMVNQAKQIAKNQGNIPDSLKRLIDNILETTIPWKEVLSRFLTETISNDYTWKSPNKRYINQGIYLPSLNDPEIGGEIAFICDTSGSISNKEMNMAGSEIYSVLTMFNYLTLRVLYVDCKFQGEQIFEVNDNINLEPIGNGGTSFVPGFEYLKREDIEVACVVYITDGCCNDFPQYPDYPVLWLLTEKNINFKPPFGEIISI